MKISDSIKPFRDFFRSVWLIGWLGYLWISSEYGQPASASNFLLAKVASWRELLQESGISCTTGNRRQTITLWGTAKLPRLGWGFSLSLQNTTGEWPQRNKQCKRVAHAKSNWRSWHSWRWFTEPLSTRSSFSCTVSLSIRTFESLTVSTALSLY